MIITRIRDKDTYIYRLLDNNRDTRIYHSDKTLLVLFLEFQTFANKFEKKNFYV